MIKTRTYLCDCCKDEGKGEEQIYLCKKCKKQLCIGCLVNIKIGALIPHDGRNIDSDYCPYCNDMVKYIPEKEKLDHTKIQKESNVGKTVEVCFNYNKHIVGIGTIIQDDIVTKIKLMDGRYILDSECQYRII